MLERRRRERLQFPHGRRLALENAGHEIRPGLSFEGRLAGGQLVEEGAKGEDVAAGDGVVSFDLLRRRDVVGEPEVEHAAWPAGVNAGAPRSCYCECIMTCEHLRTTDNAPPRTPNGCEECLKMGDRWVHLRRCLHCGHIGCCDSSKNKHATKHYRATSHPVVQSFQPGEVWKWCYVDEIMAE